MVGYNRVILSGVLEERHKTKDGCQGSLRVVNPGYRGAADRKVPVVIAAKEKAADELEACPIGALIAVSGRLHSYQLGNDRRNHHCVIVEAVECQSASAPGSTTTSSPEDVLPF